MIIICSFDIVNNNVVIIVIKNKTIMVSVIMVNIIAMITIKSLIIKQNIMAIARR